MADPEGVQVVRSNPLPPPPPRFYISYGNEIICSQWNKLVLFHGIFKKNEIKSEKRTPCLYTHEHPFQKSWIHPCKYTKSEYSQAILVIQVSLYWLLFSTSVDCCYLLISHICKQFGTRSGPTKYLASSKSKLFSTVMVFPKDLFNELI